MSETKRKIINAINKAKQKGCIELAYGYTLEAEYMPTEDGTNSFYWDYAITYLGKYIFSTSSYEKLIDYIRYKCLV